MISEQGEKHRQIGTNGRSELGLGDAALLRLPRQQLPRRFFDSRLEFVLRKKNQADLKNCDENAKERQGDKAELHRCDAADIGAPR